MTWAVVAVALPELPRAPCLGQLVGAGATQELPSGAFASSFSAETASLTILTHFV